MAREVTRSGIVDRDDVGSEMSKIVQTSVRWGPTDVSCTIPRSNQTAKFRPQDVSRCLTVTTTTRGTHLRIVGSIAVAPLRSGLHHVARMLRNPTIRVEASSLWLWSARLMKYLVVSLKRTTCKPINFATIPSLPRLSALPGSGKDPGLISGIVYVSWRAGPESKGIAPGPCCPCRQIPATGM